MDLADVRPGLRFVILGCTDVGWNWLTGTVTHILSPTKVCVTLDESPPGHYGRDFNCDPAMMWPVDHPKAQCVCRIFAKDCLYHKSEPERKTDPNLFKLDWQ